jgi:N-acetylglutamate synthase
VDALGHARQGERWVVRHRLADGSATDVIGWIEKIERESISVATSGGRVVRLATADVILARRAPAAAGGPDPLRTAAEELERYALPGWLGFSEPLGDWTLRAAPGFTARANSCLAVGDPGMPVGVAAAKIAAFSRAFGIPPQAQVIAGSQTEAELRSLGWLDASPRVDVVVGRLGDVLGDQLPDPAVQVAETLTAQWQAAYHRSSPNDADPAIVRMILDGHPPRAFGSVASGDERVVAIVRGHLSGPWLGLASVWTDPDHRGHGLATKLVIALGHWAARRGGRYVYLHVSADEQARCGYAQRGLALHHRIRYLGAPGEVQVTRSVGAYFQWKLSCFTTAPPL